MNNDSKQQDEYHNSLIRCRGYCFSHCMFGAASIWQQHSFFAKATDINNSWIKYTPAIQWRLLDAVSSKCSFSVLLSGMETSHTTQTAAIQWRLLDAVSSKCSLSVLLSGMETSHTIVRWQQSEIICICVRVPHIVAAATIWGQRLFRSELQIARLLFDGSVYSKKYCR